MGYQKEKLEKRIRATNYLTVAQLFLKNNFLLERELKFDDIKSRLLGHWGTCPGINLAYACVKAYFPKVDFILGPGHGFPALQANLFVDGELKKHDIKLSRDEAGIAHLCRSFSWPGGFPSHASPFTPGVICEGGELGYALGEAYGFALGHPDKLVAVLIGDGEFETATTASSMNLNKLLSSSANGVVLPILHLNGYKISAPTIAGRKSERELKELLRGYGFDPIIVRGDNDDSEKAISYAIDDFEAAFVKVEEKIRQIRNGEKDVAPPFIVMKTEKGMTGPEELNGVKIRGNYASHQIPLQKAKTDPEELKMLDSWLHSYRFNEVFDKKKGFLL